MMLRETRDMQTSKTVATERCADIAWRQMERKRQNTETKKEKRESELWMNATSFNINIYLLSTPSRYLHQYILSYYIVIAFLHMNYVMEHQVKCRPRCFSPVQQLYKRLLSKIIIIKFPFKAPGIP